MQRGARQCARLVGQHTPTNADEARILRVNGGACRFVFMGTAGAQDQDIFARDERRASVRSTGPKRARRRRAPRRCCSCPRSR